MIAGRSDSRYHRNEDGKNYDKHGNLIKNNDYNVNPESEYLEYSIVHVVFSNSIFLNSKKNLCVPMVRSTVHEFGLSATLEFLVL
jgi:hypothetical protein